MTHDLHDPLFRQLVITGTYDSVYFEEDFGGVMEALADCGLPDVTASEIALALSERWRMTRDEIDLLQSMITASGLANLN